MPPSLSVVTALALTHQCAPGVAPDTNVSIAKAERLQALAVHQSMSADSEILAQAYHHALRAPPSTDNTGDPVRCILNGYVAAVGASATAVPSIVAFAPRAPAHAAPTHGVAASAGAGNIFIAGNVIAGAVRWHGEAPK